MLPELTMRPQLVPWHRHRPMDPLQELQNGFWIRPLSPCLGVLARRIDHHDTLGHVQACVE